MQNLGEDLTNHGFGKRDGFELANDADNTILGACVCDSGNE
jgi:hypothetical protein